MGRKKKYTLTAKEKKRREAEKRRQAFVSGCVSIIGLMTLVCLVCVVAVCVR